MSNFRFSLKEKAKKYTRCGHLDLRTSRGERYRGRKLLNRRRATNFKMNNSVSRDVTALFPIELRINENWGERIHILNTRGNFPFVN